MKKMKTSIWDEAAKSMRENMSRRDYERIFSNVRLLSFQNGKAVLSVGDSKAEDDLRENYLTSLEKELADLSGQPVEVKFKVTRTPPPGIARSPLQPARRSDVSSPETYLNRRYTFDKFVIGEGNRLTHAAALSVARAPAKTYNPLFIYGGVGLGKTHVMQAIGNFIVDSHQHYQNVLTILRSHYEPYKKIHHSPPFAFFLDLSFAIRRCNHTVPDCSTIYCPKS